ncbi:MAG TPA: hypothetical protein ENH85_06120, partial [Candidatus Scalindua sp.]|nr:hypothetical protein [Candidatus Scalindua sp.]
LGNEIEKVERAGIDLIHVDVMDGHFVPNLTMGPFIVEGVKKKASYLQARCRGQSNFPEFPGRLPLLFLLFHQIFLQLQNLQAGIS